MFTNRIGLAALGLACVTAAGAGGFLASRDASTADPTPSASAAAPSEIPNDTASPVQETEALVEEVESPAEATGAAATATTPEPVAPKPRSAAPTREGAPRPPAPRPEPERRVARETSGATPASRASQAPPAPVEETRREQPRATPVEPPAEAARREPLEVPQLPERQFEELVVAADSVIGLQLERTISSETARVEDRVEARVTRDVRVDGRVAIPAGARVEGAVTAVERGGKMKERARLGVRFHTLVLADGTTLPLQTDTVYREGESPSNASAAKIGGGAIGGAILGAIIGGGKGAAIGGSAGAAGGTAAVMAGSRRTVALTAGSTITVRVLSPVEVTVER